MSYWLVGAAFGGDVKNSDLLPYFLECGVWWAHEPEAHPVPPTPQVRAMQTLILSMQKGDRVAIKRKNIHTQKMTIHALGVVRYNDTPEAWTEYQKWQQSGRGGRCPGAWRVYVDWLPLDLQGREVQLMCNDAICGPFDPTSHPWIKDVFHI